ncbi:MAG TPA: aminotransferase class I/II-fold pyridoxal phosphate-dependent enzyme [Candidatus Caenarcaniphilales bacterium]|nr:aminotransferase class I/II-fold pyridoxal phosphate-dependent enzyme [Candidatus Caenarcaniphilales bacterium]
MSTEVEPQAAIRQRLSARVRAVPPSGIRRFFDVIATMSDVISLGVGEPDFTTPPQIIEEGVRSLRSGRTHYTSNYGTLELRRALSAHLERLYGIRYDADGEMCITVGASEALAATMAALVDPGDEVVLHEPSYVAYLPAIVFNGGSPVLVPTTAETNFELDPATLEAAITPRTKLLFLGYPCNPTGAVLGTETLRAVADIARRHDLLVVSDEIYDRLVYGDHHHVPISSLPGMRDRTVLLGGFSKAYAMTGWRVGYVCAPRDLLEGIVKVHQYEIMSAPTTAQDAAVAAITGAEQDVQRMVEEYDRRRRMFVRGLNELGLPTVEPRGAFYAFPSIRSTGLTSEAFSERLLHEQHVAVVPGSAFGPSGEGHVRATLATGYDQLEEALLRIGRFVASQSA